MTIDSRLLKAVDRLTRVRKTTRSALIRGEFDAWIDQQEWSKANISTPITPLSAPKMNAAAGAIAFALGLIDSSP